MRTVSRIVILGGGFGGAYCARRLAEVAGRDVSITVIDRQNYLLFYPLLVEAGTGNLEPRHAAVPLRHLLKRVTFRLGEVLDVDTARREITYRVANEQPTEIIPYDHLVLALGSVSSLPPVPGLAEHAFKMKSLGDAVRLRDRMVHLLEFADAIQDQAERRRLLHVVVVGGNFTGVEVAGEYSDFMREAARLYPRIHPTDIRFSLVEILDRVLSALDPDVSSYAAETMTRRGVEFRLNNSVANIGPDSATLKSGERLETHTVIWCAGIAPNPLLRKLNLPADRKGWLLTERDARVQGFDNVWGIGDCAVNLSPDGKAYPPTAQAAIGEGHCLAENLARAVRGETTRPVEFRLKGTITPLGGHNGVVNVGKSLKISGVLAWLIYRFYYLMKIPGAGRKVRVALDWLAAFCSRRDVVQLGLQARRPAVQADGLIEKKRSTQPTM